MNKITIKNRYTNEVIFEFEGDTIKSAVTEAVKKGISLCDANLYGADLHGANFCGADLSGANFCEANLRGASLYVANLCRANLCEANLCEANLCYADLYCANLYGADLRGANFCGSGLRGAKNTPFISLACPSEGSFIGWKKVSGKLVKLEIPEDAKRSSATTNKCRCDKAKVLAITDLDGGNPIDEIVNTGYSPNITYKVGEMVYPDSFDENRWNECSHGIHFFIHKQEAINY
jgi:hypothetical protein